MQQLQIQTLRGLGESENDEDLPRFTGGALPLLHNSCKHTKITNRKTNQNESIQSIGYVIVMKTTYFLS